MAPCILIVYNAFTGENCCLHARSENPGTTGLDAYEITAPEHVVGEFYDTSEWDIVAVIDFDPFNMSDDVKQTLEKINNLAEINLRVHIDEIDVTEGSAPQIDDE